MAQVVKKPMGKPATKYQKPPPGPGTSVMVRQPQALHNLPERMAELQAQKHTVEMVEAIYATLMVNGVDYGTFPGIKKPMLYRNGAELLRLYLDLSIKDEVSYEGSDIANGIYFIRVHTDIHDKTGRFLGSGEGICTSLESKYRFRWAYRRDLPDAIYKDGILIQLDKSTPEATFEQWKTIFGANAAKIMTGDRGAYQLYRVENENIHDQANTFLSQAKKRSVTDGIKTVTGAGRVFQIGKEEIRAAVDKGEEIADIINGETKVLEEEETQEALELQQFHEQLKEAMTKANVDVIKLQELLRQEFGVEGITQLDVEGRANLLARLSGQPSPSTGEVVASPKEEPSVDADFRKFASEAIAFFKQLGWQQEGTITAWIKNNFPSCTSLKDLPPEQWQPCLHKLADLVILNKDSQSRG